MTKIEALQTIEKHGQDASFVANVILTQHSNPARKLRGLAKLLENGNEVRTAQFSIETLMVNGKRCGWETLECPEILKTWRIA